MADDMVGPPIAEAELLRERVAALEAAQDRLLRRLVGASAEAAHATERARLHAADAAAMRARLAVSQSHIEALVRSTSWRLTTPLRLVADPLLRLAGRRAPALPARVGATLLSDASPRSATAGFPLAGDLACHPALLPAPLPPLAETVSVVIPTWNAGRELGWLLRKLRGQRGLGGVEIIVVDSGSTDGTPELAASLGCLVLPIDRAAFSHSAARNLGASMARGELLLFMVQDAYPIGDDWLAGLARCLLHPAREEDRVAALSCAEFCRTDSEMIYDIMARAHYEFLGCADGDRLGRLTTVDQDGLRRQGQLSDVACLIPRAVFETFLFEGRYAEDLTLGIRMIQAGHQLGMLSSIRVAHAHNRPASYYVRRVFVDVVFLAATFADAVLPAGSEAVGAVAAATALAARLPRFAEDPRATPAGLLTRTIDRWRALDLPVVAGGPDADFGFAPLQDWTRRLFAARLVAGRRLSAAEQRGTAALRDMVLARLTQMLEFVRQAWPVADAAAMTELRDAVIKTLAMSLGAQLAACHLADAGRGGRDPLLVELKPLLLSGI